VVTGIFLLHIDLPYDLDTKVILGVLLIPAVSFLYKHEFDIRGGANIFFLCLIGYMSGVVIGQLFCNQIIAGMAYVG